MEDLWACFRVFRLRICVDIFAIFDIFVTFLIYRLCLCADIFAIRDIFATFLIVFRLRICVDIFAIFDIFVTFLIYRLCLCADIFAILDIFATFLVCFSAVFVVGVTCLVLSCRIMETFRDFSTRDHSNVDPDVILPWWRVCERMCVYAPVCTHAERRNWTLVL